MGALYISVSYIKNLNQKFVRLGLFKGGTLYWP